MNDGLDNKVVVHGYFRFGLFIDKVTVVQLKVEMSSTDKTFLSRHGEAILNLCFVTRHSGQHRANSC